MIGVLIALLIVGVLWVLPIGVRLAYNQDSGYVGLRFGFISVRLYPKPKKAEATQETNKSNTTNKKTEKTQGSSLTDFIPIVNIVLDFLSDFRRKLWVRNLKLKLILAGDDPCDLAVHYGEAWAALSSLFPLLEQYVKIKDRNLEVLCDFTASHIRVLAHADILITLGDFLIIGLRHGVRGLKEYFIISKKIKAVQ